MEVIAMEDIRGEMVYVEPVEIIQKLIVGPFKVFGVEINDYTHLIRLYQSLGGKMPINEENIESLIESSIDKLA